MLGISPVKSLPPFNYENRNIILNVANNNNCFTNHNEHKINNLRIYSDDSAQSTPSKCSSLDNTVIEKHVETPKLAEPPPLPPKPKIIPIKPPNWGQNGFYKNKDLASDKKALYLEQPSSSFV